jgi:HEPN domain-containing protein
MKTQADLVKGWLRKADSDVTTASLCIEREQALDTACFHAQQAAEKCLKAYLTAYAVEFPFVHNLEKLIELYAQRDASFFDIKAISRCARKCCQTDSRSGSHARIPAAHMHPLRAVRCGSRPC